MGRKSGIRKSRLIGLMAGITIGFAAWGSQKAVPVSADKMEYRMIQNGKADWDTAKNYHAAVLGNTPEPIPEEGLSLHAQSAVLMDADSGRILYGKDAFAVRPMASTTKIMTCILALELGDLDDECVISQQAAAQPKVKLGAPAGSRIRLEDLLYSLMLESHNDSAVAIAEHIGGSVEAFAEIMNRKAQEIGCQNTTFLTPNGLDAAQKSVDGSEVFHSTTAGELADILRYCTEVSSKRDEFLTITRSQAHSFFDEEKRNHYDCVNHNALLSMTPEAVTGKTGFTGNAGYCYAAELSDGERKFIITLLGCGWPPHKTWKWSDVKKLYQYGKNHFFYRDFSFQEAPVRVLVEDGAYKDWVFAVSETPGQERTFHLLVSGGEQVTAKPVMTERMKAPVFSGEIAGRMEYRLGEELIGQSNYYTDTCVEAWTLGYCIHRLFQLWLFSEM